MHYIAFILFTFIRCAAGFTSIIPVKKTVTMLPSFSLLAFNTYELIETPNWDSIQKELDEVPVFACSSLEGNAIKQQVHLSKFSKDRKTAVEVPIFYTHVEDAIIELDKVREKQIASEINIIPFPLGEIFKLWAIGKAIIVPNKKAIIQAGAPLNVDPLDQIVPLFACMEIAHENDDGIPVFPLFFELQDANAAVSQAVSIDGGSVDNFEVMGLSLSDAIRMFGNTVDEIRTFHFIPPSSSMDYIQDYRSE